MKIENLFLLQRGPMLAGTHKGQPSDLIKGPFEMVGQCTSGKITEEELEQIARTRFNRIGNQFTGSQRIFHPAVIHGNSITNPDSRKFHRRSPFIVLRDGVFAGGFGKAVDWCGLCPQ